MDLSEFQDIVDVISGMHFAILSAVRKETSQGALPSTVSKDTTHGDVTYEIDARAEDLVLNYIEILARGYRVKLVMEGVEQTSFGHPANPPITVVIDPIDGTREIMYDKRSAWILTGIAFADGDATLRDIKLAMQTEIPTSKHRYFSQLIAAEGQGFAETVYEVSSLGRVHAASTHKPSSAIDLADGFVCFPSPFPGPMATISKIYEQFYTFAVQQIPDVANGAVRVFSDEYISTGGQMYLLATGRYRLVADIREHVQSTPGSLCCHPYDLCTELIAREAGAVIVKVDGEPLDYDIDTTTNCNWVGFANCRLNEVYFPLLSSAINAVVS